MQTNAYPQMKSGKYYVVWKGYAPGVYDSWEECQLQINGYKDAKYKSFPTEEAAVQAFRGETSEHLDIINGLAKALREGAVPEKGYIEESLAVDAACSGNPGKMEYRGVYTRTGAEIFKVGPYEQGTNNIGEFLAIVHALALLKQRQSSLPVYSDSANAIAWVRQKRCNTKLEQTALNKPLFDLIARAEKWLRNNSYTTRIYKWETKQWGEIPADFGRK